MCAKGGGARLESGSLALIQTNMNTFLSRAGTGVTKAGVNRPRTE